MFWLILLLAIVVVVPLLLFALHCWLAEDPAVQRALERDIAIKRFQDEQWSRWLRREGMDAGTPIDNRK